MKEAVLDALRDPDPVRATLHFTQLIQALTAENAPAAFQALSEKAGTPEAARLMSLLAHAWGAKDGKAALAAFDTLRGRDGDSARSTALAAWAALDPDAARQWLTDRAASKDPKADPRQEMALTRGLLSGLARRDAGVALDYLMTLDEKQQGDLISVLTDQKLGESIAAGAEWAARLPTTLMRTNALETVGERFLRQDLDGAAQWAEQIAARPEAHEAVADVADRLAGRDPLAATAWVAKLPAGPSQDHAFEDVFERWTRGDPLAASQSLAGMTPGPGRDSAIQAFSRTLAKENPADALTWAAAMTDPGSRADVQVEIARRWHSSAPDAAAPWISAHLAPDLQARALAPKNR